jgi:hypothetical protein
VEQTGKVAGAVNVSRSFLEFRAGGTAALAASIISFKLVAMCLLLLRVFPVRGPSLCAGQPPFANLQ